MSTDFRTVDLDYTSRDYESIIDWAVARIQNFTSEWTDHSASDPGIVILQLLAGMSDVLHYYVDRKLKEALITDVKGRENIIKLIALVGGRPIGAAPARTNVDFSIAATLLDPVSIPARTVCVTVGLTPPIQFETAESVVIPAGALSVFNVPVIQGVTTLLTLIAAAADGSAFQAYKLPGVSILDEGIEVFVNAEEWTYTDELLLADPLDKVWTFSRDADSNVWLVFGNGSVTGGNGLIPPNGQTIESRWREGGGANTNVGAGVIRSVASTLFAGGSPVTVDVINPLAAFGGDEEESIESMRKRVPRLFRSNDRGVTAQDYEALAESVPGVVQADAVVAGVGFWLVYIVPSPLVGVGVGVDPFGYAVLSTIELSQQALAAHVDTILEGKKMGTDAVEGRLISFAPVDADFEVFVEDDANRAQIEEKLTEVVAEFFDVETRSVGNDEDEIGDADLGLFRFNVRSIEGVRRVRINKFNLRPQVKTLLGTNEIVLSSFGINDTTKDALWRIVMIDNSTFAVYRQELAGGPLVKQANNGALGVSFVADNDKVEFVVTAGAPAPAAGDQFEVRASPLLGSVRILTGEIAAQGQATYALFGGV